MDTKEHGLGVLELIPKRIADARGFLSETYSAAHFAEFGIHLRFVQDNHVYTEKAGVLRGLHYQLPDRAQHKLLRVVRGRLFDVAVDIRRSSSTFGKWVGLEISAEKGNQILVPTGFAHGYLTLESHTEVIYKMTEIYSPEYERSIRYDDPEIGIEWPALSIGALVSDKDAKAPLLAEAEVFK